MPRIIHFELPISDIERASTFYADVFGWKVQGGENGYWLVTTGSSDDPGIDGGFIDTKWASQLVNIIGVDSIDDYLAKAEAAGAKTLRGKEPVGPIGWAAYIEDPEGNTVGLFESRT